MSAPTTDARVLTFVCVVPLPSQAALHHALRWLGMAWCGECLSEPPEIVQFYLERRP